MKTQSPIMWANHPVGTEQLLKRSLLCARPASDLLGPHQHANQSQATESSQLWTRLCLINPGLWCMELQGLLGTPRDRADLSLFRLCTWEPVPCLWGRSFLRRTLTHKRVGPSCSCLLPLLLVIFSPHFSFPSLCFFFFPVVKDTLLFYSSTIIITIVLESHKNWWLTRCPF